LHVVEFTRQLETHPDRIISLAVRGMLPKNRNTQRYLDNLKVYAGPEHPHQAQNPQPLVLE
jgi:large subunit ribosomal protein L13